MRFRVAASLAALVLLVILVQSGIMVLLLHEKEEEFIEKQLGDQIEHSMELFRRSPDASLPSTPAMWLYRVGQGA
ncbi:MAG TPA: sensor histidine kinase, partial [Azonexus sp.]|nr:sensor histidine kinase [Azonexus sp.]